MRVLRERSVFLTMHAKSRESPADSARRNIVCEHCPFPDRGYVRPEHSSMSPYMREQRKLYKAPNRSVRRHPSVFSETSRATADATSTVVITLEVPYNENGGTPAARMELPLLSVLTIAFSKLHVPRIAPYGLNVTMQAPLADLPKELHHLARVIYREAHGTPELVLGAKTATCRASDVFAQEFRDYFTKRLGAEDPLKSLHQKVGLSLSPQQCLAPCRPKKDPSNTSPSWLGCVSTDSAENASLAGTIRRAQMLDFIEQKKAAKTTQQDSTESPGALSESLHRPTPLPPSGGRWSHLLSEDDK